MLRLEMTLDEARTLHKILEEYLSDVRVQLTHTDIQEFREYLKNEDVFIRQMIARLEAEGLVYPEPDFGDYV